MLVREVTEEQKAADRAAVLDSPAFATVLDFFEVAAAIQGPRSHVFLQRGHIAGPFEKIHLCNAADVLFHVPNSRVRMEPRVFSALPKGSSRDSQLAGDPNHDDRTARSMSQTPARPVMFKGRRAS